MFKLNSNNAGSLVYTFEGGISGDGAFPDPSLVRDAAGNLYGTTVNGGAFGLGTIFKIAANGQETVIYSFKGSADGANPSGGVCRDSNGNLYGSTSLGGTYNQGTVFKVIDSGEHTVLHNFNGSEGSRPIGGVSLDLNGNLFGATYQVFANIQNSVVF